jgi:hypothetical protein
MKLTIKDCLDHADSLGVPIYGDVKLRGEYKKEDPELATFHQWVIFNYPHLEPLCFHYPNEWSATSKTGGQYAHAAKMANMGVKPRLADWIFTGTDAMPPFFLEMKRENLAKSISSTERKRHFCEQCDLLHRQKQLGAVVCIALGADNAKRAFIEYMEKYSEPNK